MDRQKIIDACRDIIAATQQILDAVTQEQETELAMGKPSGEADGTLAQPR